MTQFFAEFQQSNTFIMKLVWAFLIVCLIARIHCEDRVPPKKLIEEQGDVKQRTKLLKFLTEDYDPRVNPDSPNGVQFGVSLINVDLDEEKSTLESNVWLKYTWEDSRLVWDENEWGISVIRAKPSTFWLPDITLYNSADLSTKKDQCWESNILIYPTGKVLWVPPCHLSSFCKTSLKTHPYSDQLCFLKFGSWTFDSNIMDINFYNNDTSIDLSDYWDLSDWKIVDNAGQKHIKYYACCAEPYNDLTFNITLRRKPESESLCEA